jgi:hypothetical protein
MQWRMKLESIKACKYIGVEESNDIEHKNDKENLKKECVRRLRLTLNIQLGIKIKCKQLEHR